MRKVIRIDEPKEENKKPIELIKKQTGDGWEDVDEFIDKDFDKIVYLGKCEYDGDMFAVYSKTIIEVFKGELNDGIY